MPRYFVKSHFHGWCEVPYENYLRFIENIQNNATGIKSSEKNAYILRVTHVMCDSVSPM